MPSAPRPHRRTNVDRTEVGKTFDAPYLASLSTEWHLRYYELSLSRTNEAGAAPWYQVGYDRLLRETPYEFRRPAKLLDPARLPASCEPNRGPESAPLFLLNHWVGTDPAPRPSNAARVNAFEPLLRRARECERIRGRLPNLVAVDFYAEGDLLRVVDALNGL